MRIKLFGTPSVWDGELQVGGALSQRRRLALVVVLAGLAPPGRPALPRERLLQLLWPSEDEERARAALSQALYAVRRDLGADDAIVGTGELRLNPERVSCDYWDFRQALADGGDSEAAMLRSAPLLEDFEVPEAPAFEPWSEELRLEAERQWAAAADRAATRALRDGDLARALLLRRALANADPLSSRTAIALATVLAQSGDREAALRHLRVHGALVEQELEAEPAPEVKALLAQLQRGEIPPLPSPAPESAADTIGSVASPTIDAPPPVAAEQPNGAPPAAASAPDSSGRDAPRATYSRRAVAAVVGLTLIALSAIAVARRPPAPAPNGAARSDDVPVIAVGRISGDSLGEAVRGMLATGLARAEAVAVVSGARMLELQGAFPDAPSGTLRAAREAGASDLIEGTLLRDGSGWRLALTRTDVRTGTVATSLDVDGRELFALVDSATSSLLAGFTRRAADGSVAEVSTRSITAWQLYQQALSSQAGGRYAAARAQLRGALAEDEGFVMAAAALANLSSPGSPEQRAILRDAMRVRDRAPRRDADFLRALWLLAENDPAAAAVFDTLALRYPADLDIRMNLANPALFQRADFRAAYAALESAWRADSVRIGRSGGGRCYACEVPIHITTVAEHEDSLAVGERWLRRYLALAPEDGRAWDRLGAVLERDVSRHRELEDVVARAVQNGHTYARGLLLLAATRRGDTAVVARMARELMTPDDSAGLHWSLAIVYRNVGRLDEALREAQAHSRQMSRRADPPVDPQLLEAVVYLERGDGRRAAEIFERLGRLNAREAVDPITARRVAWNRTLGASARFEAGDTTGLFALADSLAVIGLRSRYVRDHYLHHHVRGLAWLAQGRLDDAIAELERSIVFPSLGLTRSNWYLAQALRQRGRRDEARRVLEAAARASRDGAGLYLNPVAVRAALRDLR